MVSIEGKNKKTKKIEKRRANQQRAERNSLARRNSKQELLSTAKKHEMPVQ